MISIILKSKNIYTDSLKLKCLCTIDIANVNIKKHKCKLYTKGINPNI